MPDAVTYYIFIRDHSGSMDWNTEDDKVKKSHLAMMNFNEQLAKIKKDNDNEMENIITVIEFDDQIYCNIENMPVNEVEPLTSYWTGGMTSLNDAIANGINKVKAKMEADSRENKAACAIIQTDGLENNSSDYKGPEGTRKIQEMIKDLEENSDWTFIFLGENLDPKVVEDLGINMNNSMLYKGDSGSVRYAYSMQSNGMDSYLRSRKGGVTKTSAFFNQGNSDAKYNNTVDNDTFNSNEGNDQ